MIMEEPLDKLFSRIAPYYDGLNHLFSLCTDSYWRSVLARRAVGKRILDVCTGTGDTAIALARGRAGAEIIGLDFSAAMLRIGERKLARRGLASRVRLVDGDALSLPFADNSFDSVSIAFGLRNLPDRRRGLAEMSRVLKPGGKLLVLEFAPPTRSMWGLAFRWYLRWIIPALGELVSRARGAYRYLFSSVVAFHTPEEMVAMLEGAELVDLNYRPLSGGITSLYSGRKPDEGFREHGQGKGR
jgi:demethylmenaquinone methyltransferase/2-methoxy-6-polyprenyl-1,4-benzoquinol methylase